MIERVDKFIKDVTENESKYPKSIVDCVNRHINDLQRDDIYFDKKIASKHLKFISMIPLIDGEWSGMLMKEALLDWQVFFWASMHGWRRKKDGKRRFTSVYLQIPKKNSKTTMAAITAIDMGVNDSLEGSQIYFAGYSIDTAALCFDFTKNILLKMFGLYPTLKNKIEILAHRIIINSKRVYYKKVSSDPSSLEGKGSRLSVVDEVHTHRNSHVIDNLRSGSALYDDPLEFLITTPGFDKNEPCPAYGIYEYFKKVNSGILVADNKFAMIWEAEETENWHNEEVWAKVNPNIGVSPKWEFLREQYNEAKTKGGRKEVDFKIKHLGMWTNSDSVWIGDDVYMANQVPLVNIATNKKESEDFWDDIPKLCFGGVDLGAVTDFCAFNVLHAGDGIDYSLTKYYLPEDTVRSHKDENIRIWTAQGFITATPGRTTDYAFIKQDIIKTIENYDMELCFYDRMYANELVTSLADYGYTMIPFANTTTYMNLPTKTLEKNIIDGNFKHGCNPVTRWMFGNVKIIEDNNKNIRIGKRGNKAQVDGPVSIALSMAAKLEYLSRPTSNPTIIF